MSELDKLLGEIREGANRVLSLADAIEEMFSSAPEEKKPAKPKNAKKPISLSDVKAVLMEKARSGLNNEVQALIKSYGVEKLSAIDPSDYEELLKKAEELKQ